MLREKRTSDLDITFSYYWLSPFLKDVEHKTAATTVKHLTSKEVKNAEILAPRKSIQQKIGAILQTTDSAIEKTQALIAKYESIKQGMMQDLFTRGVDESGQLRPSYEDAPHLYHETELGWIPKDWAVERLDNLAEIDRGKFTHRPRNDPRMYGGEYPFIQTSDVTASNGGEIDTFNQTLSKAGTRVSKSFPRGTIAVTIAANIADTGFLGREMYFPDSVVGVQVSDPNNRHFVELCIRMNKQQLDALAPQSAQKNINLEDLRPMLVPRPSPDEQKAIADRYRAITSKIESEKIFLAKLHKTKLGLMQDLLTGKVRVAEDIDERKEAVA
jgi:type I restriction enzyme S subunit